MGWTRSWIVAVLLAAFAPARAAEPSVTASEEAAVRLAVDRGALIYAYDKAAWHGSDDLAARLPGAPGKIGGWIVDGPADAPRLVFFDRDQADPKAVYVADFEGTRLVSSRVLGDGDDRALSAARKAMIAARRAASAALVKSKARLCKDSPFNTVVLPPAAPGGSTLVYFLTPQTDLKSIPMGGHYRVEVTAEGKAGKPRPFTNSCMEMPLEREGERPEALMLTHLLDRTPTEIHVFSSLAAALPIYVSTTKNGALWAVEGRRISLVGK